MSFSTSIRNAVRIAPMLALPFLSASCDDTSGGGVCGAQLSANIEVLVDASADLQAEATSMSNTLLAACDGIITDLGGTPPAHTGSLDAQVMASCEAAGTAITAAKVGGNVTIEYTAPRCYINAEAQLSCEAECDVSGECTEGSVEARCTPGEFSVECSGTCSATAECIATVEQPTVTCAGSCEGICEGTCSGGSNADGSCNGTCTGDCRGACDVTAGSASASCEGEFRCEGSCSGTATAPRCDVELTPPMCDLDAQCQAGCEGQASFDATCEPAQVVVDVTGNPANANIQLALENALPKILAIRDGTAHIVASGQALGTAVANVTTSLTAVPACAAARAQQLAAAATGAANAAASVSVSVSVSVDVSASASGSL